MKSLFILFFVLFSPIFSFAQVSLENPITNANDVPSLVKSILEGIVKMGIPVIALAIIYSGFLYVFAMGKPGEIEKAHKAFIYTLIGAVLVLGAWGLSQIIVETVQGL